MRITWLMPPDDLTGGNRVVATYARILSARGHVVQVVSNAPAQPGLRERLRALRRGDWKNAFVWRRPQAGHVAQSGVVHKTLPRHRPIRAADLPEADILIATWWETAVWMHRMPAEKGLRVHLIQGYEVWGGEQTHASVHAALRLPNLKLAISAGLKRDIEQALGPLGIEVIPNAVDLKQFDAPARARNTPPTVGFIYATAAIKGSDRCLEAIARARLLVPDLKVIAFGAEAVAPALPLPPGTTYVQFPAQSQLASLYAACDAWLFTSRLDSFGLPILEAMACRTPVIGVPIGAAPDLLGHGAGVLVDAAAEDALVDALAKGIVSLCTMPAEAWCAMSDMAYRVAHAYSWEDAADRLEARLCKALSTTGAAGAAPAQRET